MLRLFLPCLFLIAPLSSNCQVKYCYSRDTVQSEDKFLRLTIDAFDYKDVTQTIFKIETSTPINARKLRMSIGTPDMLLQRTIDYEIYDGKLKLRIDPFAFANGSKSISLFANYEYSSTDPIVVTWLGAESEACNMTKPTSPSFQSKWDKVLLSKAIVPSRDALALINTYNPRRHETRQDVIYPAFVPVDPEESLAFSRQYLADLEPDPRLANFFKKAVGKLKQRIEGAENLLLTLRGEISMRDYILREINENRKVVLNHLGELHEGLNGISDNEVIYQIPRITLSIVLDELNTLNNLIPELKDTANNRLVMQFVNDLQLLTYPYASKTLQSKSSAATYHRNSTAQPNFNALFHFAFLPEIKENYLRPFHFYIYKNAEPAPKKQYRVYCVPAAKYEYYIRKGKNLKDLSLYMSQELASVSRQNLPLAVYYVFAVKSGETKWSIEPQRFHTGRIVRESTNNQLPYSFCIDVKN